MSRWEVLVEDEAAGFLDAQVRANENEKRTTNRQRRKREEGRSCGRGYHLVFMSASCFLQA